MVHDFDPAIIHEPLAIYWYGAVYSLGFIGVFLWFRIRQQLLALSEADTYLLTIFLAVGVMIGGRVFDILVYELDYYRDHPTAIINWWEGGMASHGVLLGALIGTVLFARWRRRSLLELLDEMVVPGVFLLAVGRLGNFIEGGVVGRVTDLWWGFEYADLDGPRHPVALYESAKNFVILPVLIWSLNIWPAGRGVVMSIFVLLYAALRFAVDLFRDYEAAWLGIGTGQVFNLVMAAAGLLLLIWFVKRPRRAWAPPSVRDRPAGRLAKVLLVVLILYPLGIPTSWTRANITEKRQSVIEVEPLPDPVQEG